MKTNIYLLKAAEWPAAEDIEAMLRLFPKNRRDKVMQCRERHAQTQHALAYALLAAGLAADWGFEHMPDTAAREKGKPYLRDYPQVFFNFSHCAVGILCGISEGELGVDIEPVKPFKDKLAERVCHENEKKILWTQPEDERGALFGRIWTSKESYLKYLGCGIDRPLSSLDLSDCEQQKFCAYGAQFYLFMEEGLVMAICQKEASAVTNGCAAENRGESFQGQEFGVRKVTGRELAETFCRLSKKTDGKMLNPY